MPTIPIMPNRWSLVSSLALLLIGCGEGDDEAILGPGLMVLRADADGWKFSCDAYCPDASDAGVVAKHCKETKATDELADNCTFRGGQHRVYVVADLSAIPELARDSKASGFTAALTIDGETEVRTSKLGPLQSYPGEPTQYYVGGYVTLPADRTGGFRVRVSSDEQPGFFTEASESLSLELPEIAVKFVGCVDEPCEEEPCNYDCTLPAGAGRLGLDVSVVPDFPLNLVRIRERLDELLLRDEPWTTDATRGTPQQRTFSRTLAAPDNPGTIWTVTTGFGDEAKASDVDRRRVRLRPLTALRLDVTPGTEQPNFEKATLLERARFEPEASCRALRFGVHSDDLVPGTSIALTTSLGTLDAQSAGIPKTLDGAGSVIVALDLPSSIELAGTATSLTVTASHALQGTFARQVDLQPILPVKAALSVAVAKVNVAASGSSSYLLKGFAIPPAGVLSFVPGVSLSVHVEATASNGGVLTCGAPVTAEALTCDPSQAQVSGGCLATPRQVAVAADGGFSVPIEAGLCFQGKLSVTIRGERYVEEEGCLGDRKRAVEVLDTAEVEFIPVP